MSDHTPVEGVEPVAAMTRTPSYRYRLCRELDSGGMATVYLARMEGPGGFEKLVAVKTIHPHLASRKEIVEMFLDEAQIVAELSHPNICSVVDFGCINQKTYFIAMEYVFGETLSRLARRVRKSETRPEMWHAYIAHIIANAAEGLHAAHELRDANGNPRNVVHRDVTPNNICIAYDGSVRVMDFGIARAEGQVHQTRSIALKGKIAYMAPEQFTEGGIVDRRSDVWSLGVVLWELLTLKRMFRRNSDPQTALAICQEEIVDPRQIDPTIPEPLADAAIGAICRDRDERMATTRELSKILRGYLATLGQPLGMPEISELMDSVFAEERAQKQLLVDDAKTMADPAPLASLSTHALRIRDIANGTPNASLSGSTLETLSEEATETLAKTTHRSPPAPSEQMIPVVPSVRKKSPLLLAGFAAAAVGVGVLAFMLASSRDTKPAASEVPKEVASAKTVAAETTAAPEEKRDPLPPASEPEPEPEPEPEAPAKVDSERDRAKERAAKKRELEKKAKLEREARLAAERERTRESEREKAQLRADEARKKRLAEERERERLEAERRANEKREAQSRAAEAERQALEEAARKQKQQAAKPALLAPFKTVISVRADGALSDGEVGRAVKRQRSKFSACYASARKAAGRDAFGTVTVRFRIGSSKKAKGVSPGTAKLSGLASCVSRHMKNVRTVNASDTGDTKVRVRITFKKK